MNVLIGFIGGVIVTLLGFAFGIISWYMLDDFVTRRVHSVLDDREKEAATLAESKEELNG